MNTSKHEDRKSLLVTAVLSVSVSVALTALPFLVPGIPIGPIVLLNWMLFMVASYLALPKPITFTPPFKTWERKDKRIWLAIFVAFTSAGWLAFSNAQSMFETGDLADLRQR